MNYSLKTHQGKRKDNQDYAGVFLNLVFLAVLSIDCLMMLFGAFLFTSIYYVLFNHTGF